MKANTQFLMWLPKYENLLPIHTYEIAALSILHCENIPQLFKGSFIRYLTLRLAIL